MLFPPHAPSAYTSLLAPVVPGTMMLSNFSEGNPAGAYNWKCPAGVEVSLAMFCVLRVGDLGKKSCPGGDWGVEYGASPEGGGVKKGMQLSPPHLRIISGTALSKADNQSFCMGEYRYQAMRRSILRV